MKQSHAAELLGVSQPQISRWESGTQEPGQDEARLLADLLSARLAGGADGRLGKFVGDSVSPLHLICDMTHRLLAYSSARARQFRRVPEELDGALLWECASPDIIEAERNLETLGWFDLVAPIIELETTGHRSHLLEIPESRFTWTRFRLSDGRYARLVETIN